MSGDASIASTRPRGTSAGSASVTRPVPQPTSNTVASGAMPSSRARTSEAHDCCGCARPVVRARVPGMCSPAHCRSASAPGYPRRGMSEGTVRIAAIQATPVILDAEAHASRRRARLLAEAAADGVAAGRAARDLRPALSVERVGEERRVVRRLGRAVGSGSGTTRSTFPDRSPSGCARPAASTASTARSESTSASPSGPALSTTLCSCSGPGGLLHKHRKLMPTMHERLFHGIGAGDDLDVDRDPGRADRRPDLLGEPDAAGALCRLPRRPADLGRADRRRQRRLAGERCATSRSNPVPSSSRCRSTSRPSRSRPTFRCRCPKARRCSADGGAAIVEPGAGKVIAGPLYGEEGIVAGRLRPARSAWWPSAGSTPSATTAARTSSRVRTESRHHTARQRQGTTRINRR